MFWHIVVLYHPTSYYRESHVVTFFSQGVSRWIKCLAVLSFRAILFFAPSILFFCFLLIFFRVFVIGKRPLLLVFSQPMSPSFRKLINTLRYLFMLESNDCSVVSFSFFLKIFPNIISNLLFRIRTYSLDLWVALIQIQGNDFYCNGQNYFSIWFYESLL